MVFDIVMLESLGNIMVFDIGMLENICTVFDIVVLENLCVPHVWQADGLETLSNHF